MKPKLAICNFFSDPQVLKDLAQRYGFSGIDWSFDERALPATMSEESAWAQSISTLEPLEIRFHCPFYHTDLGHNDPAEVKKAQALFCHIVRLVSAVGGKYLTVHIGLGYDSTEPLSWKETIDNLGHLVQYASGRGVKICLENLAWGWTSKPHLFEKLIRGSGAGITLDIGHAHASESVRSHYYCAEDFVTPHSERVFNAHIYHTEVSGLGHIPPGRPEDIEDRLNVLQDVGCQWWVLEVRETDGLLQTKNVVDEYFTKNLSDPL